MVVDQRKHKMCYVKDCERLAVFVMTVDATLDNELVSKEIQVCPKHESLITRGSNVDISMSSRGIDAVQGHPDASHPGVPR